MPLSILRVGFLWCFLSRSDFKQKNGMVASQCLSAGQHVLLSLNMYLPQYYCILLHYLYIYCPLQPCVLVKLFQLYCVVYSFILLLSSFPTSVIAR